MNIQAMQTMLGATQRLMTQRPSVSSSESQVSFHQLLKGDELAREHSEEKVHASELDSIMANLFNATSIEEVVDVLLANGFVTEKDLLTMQSDDSIDELLQKMIRLLEDSEIVNDYEIAPYGNGLASLLQFIDHFAPMFFTEYANAIDGKGNLSQDNAFNLLAILKSVEIIAPQKDLLLKQEQQLFTLQNYLTTANDQLTTKMQAHVSELHIPRFMERQPMHVQAEQFVSIEQGQKESPKEVSQFVIHQVSGGKGESPLTELDNKKAARTETLLREIQAIFKRANFGQVGGTHRLLIKLYPEHLGQVRIELLQTNGVLTARLLASTALGKEMLESQLNQLRQAFLQQNIQVERIEVAQTLQDTPRSDRDQQLFQQHSGKREQKSSDNGREEHQDEKMTFEQYLIELEV